MPGFGEVLRRVQFDAGVDEALRDQHGRVEAGLDTGDGAHRSDGALAEQRRGRGGAGLHEERRGQLEDVGERGQVVGRGVELAGLDPAYPRLRHAGACGERGLGQPA